MNKLFVATALAFSSSVAFAQTCASPQAVVTEAPYSATGNTCTASQEFSQICSGGIGVLGRSHVYQVEVGATNTFTITVTPSGGYDTTIALIGPGSCGPAAPCPGGAANAVDNAGPDAAEVIDLPDNIPAGTHYLVVTSTTGGSAAAPDCGAYSVAISPTLPVELQSFSID